MPSQGVSRGPGDDDRAPHVSASPSIFHELDELDGLGVSKLALGGSGLRDLGELDELDGLGLFVEVAHASHEPQQRLREVAGARLASRHPEGDACGLGHRSRYERAQGSKVTG